MPIGKVPPPEQHPDEQPIVCIPINVEWIPILLGALQPLKYPEYWGGTLEENRRARKDFGLLINQIMSQEACGMSVCCEPAIYIYRTNPETGRMERSADNGETWTPDPADPLYMVKTLPPISRPTSGGTKCDAATNALEHIEDLITTTSENIGTAITVFELAVAVAGFLLEVFLIVLTGGAATPAALTIAGLIWAAATASFVAGKTAFDDYWTNDAKDKLLCALFCNIGADGRFTEAGYEQFKHDVRIAEIPSPALDMVMTSLNAGGFQGLNQMASYGAAAGADCADCECSDFIRLWVSTGGGTELDWDGEWLTCNGVAGGGHYTSFIQISNPSGTFDPNDCGSIEIELLEGTIDILDSAMAVCGHALGDFVPIGIAPFPGTSVVQLALRNFEDVNFVVRVRGTAS